MIKSTSSVESIEDLTSDEKEDLVGGQTRTVVWGHWCNVEGQTGKTFDNVTHVISITTT